MLKIFLYSTLVAVAWSACNECHSENPIACHSETKYSLCYNGVPTNNYTECPEDHVCTAESSICAPKSQAIPPSCSIQPAKPAASRDPLTFCKEIRKSGSFKPVGDTEFKSFILCYEINGIWYGTLRTCPSGQFFDNVSSICVAKRSESCANTSAKREAEVLGTAGLTMPSVPRDPMTFCQEVQKSGSFKPDGDTACKRFLLCYQLNDIFYGLYRDCPNGEYFDELRGLCAAKRPENCDDSTQ